MIRVKLNDAIQVDVNTDDPAIATQEANAYFRQNHPREFSQWRNSQVGILGTLGRGLVAGVDNAEANLYAVAEGLSQTVNLPSLQEFARQGRERAAQRAAEILPESVRPPTFEEAQSAGDYARFAAGAIGGSLPSTIAPIAGGIVGGAVGGVPGAVVGAALGAYPELAGGNIRRQQEVSGQITSPGLAFGAAVPQALTEGLVDTVTLRLARILGRPAEEVGRSLLPRILRGAGFGAATEAPAEVFQQLLERAQAGLDIASPDAMREYKEAAAAAAVAGGVLGGTVSGAYGARPALPAAAPEAAPQETTPTTFAQAPQPAAAPAPAAEVEAAPTPPAAPAAEAQAAPAPAPEAAPAPAPAPVTGFTTAKGSTYEVNEQGQTIRTKLSEGPGQGTTYAPHNALYVQPDVADNLLQDLQGGAKYRFIINTPEGPRYAGPDDAIQNYDTFLAVVNRDGAVERIVEGSKEPAVGLAPVELRYDLDENGEVVANRHIGNPIIELRQAAPEEVQQAAPEPAPEAPAPEAAPTPQVTPEQEQDLWRGYSLNAGPAARDPIVQAARDISASRTRFFTRPEFTQFVQQLSGASSPEAVQQVFENFGTARPQAQAQAAQPEARPVNAEEEIQQGPELRTAEQGRERLRRNYDDIFGKYSALKYFSSPIMTLGKVVPAFKRVSDAIKTMYVRTQMATVDFGTRLESLAKLSPESRAKVTLAMQEARSKQQAPDQNAFTPQEWQAMQDQWALGQRALDYMIEAYVHKYFDPQQVGGKHLWEFTPAQLEAMSPDGWAEIQKYNAMRDPFYFPQMASGTHFVGAYERQADGKEKLVRLYDYTPSEGLARVRGFENPEARAINYLREEFAGNPNVRIMTRGMPFESDQNAQDLRVNGDFIARYLQELRNVSGQNGQRVLDRMAAELDKAKMNSLFRPYKDILRAVRPDNAASYGIDMLPKYYLALAKLQARRYIQDDFNSAIEPLSPNDRAYWQDLIDYSTAPSEAYGAARGLAFFMFLGAAPDTALINLTQTPFVTLPRLLRDGGAGTTRHLLSAYKTAVFNRAFSKVLSGELAFTNDVISRILNKDEAAALIKAREQGIFTPLFTNESRGQFTADSIRNAGIADKGAAGLARKLNQGTELFGRFMQAAEETNRLVTFLAAYRSAKANPKLIDTSNYVDKTNYKSPFEYAANVVYDTQFITSKEDRALIQRFRPEAEVATQFMSFPLKMVEQYARHASMVIKNWDDPVMRKAGATALAGMIAPLIAFAGVWGLPFADSLREILERLIKLVWGDSISFKVEAEKLLGRDYGQMLNYGWPHAYGYASLQRRLGIDPLPVEELLSSSTLALFGPVGGLAEKVPQAFTYYGNGDWWGLAATMLPRSVGNVIKGAQLEFANEQLTRRGNVLITPEKLEEMGRDSWVSPSVRQALGFPPPEVFNMRDTIGRQKDIQDAARSQTERAHRELSRYILLGIRARESGDLEEAGRQFSLYRERLNEINREQDGRPLAQRIIINQNAIRQNVLKDMQGVAAPETLVQGTRRAGRPELVEELRRQGQLPAPN